MQFSTFPVIPVTSNLWKEMEIIINNMLTFSIVSLICFNHTFINKFFNHNSKCYFFLLFTIAMQSSMCTVYAFMLLFHTLMEPMYLFIYSSSLLTVGLLAQKFWNIEPYCLCRQLALNLYFPNHSYPLGIVAWNEISKKAKLKKGYFFISEYNQTQSPPQQFISHHSSVE